MNRPAIAARNTPAPTPTPMPAAAPTPSWLLLFEDDEGLTSLEVGSTVAVAVAVR
jgi:hypothetical protein